MQLGVAVVAVVKVLLRKGLFECKSFGTVTMNTDE